MAGRLVELLLVVVTGTLLLVSVRGWEEINETQLLSFFETGQWAELFGSPGFVSAYATPKLWFKGETGPLILTRNNPWSSPDDDSDFDEVDEDAVVEAEGVDTGETLAPFADYEFLVDEGDSDSTTFAGSTESGFHVEFIDVPPRSWVGFTSPSSTGLSVECSEAGFKITLPAGPLEEVKVLGVKELVSITAAPESCGYKTNPLKNILTVPFAGCNVRRDTEDYRLQLLYINALGEAQVATVYCEGNVKPKPDLLPRTVDKPSKCTNAPWKAQNCAVPVGEQVSCGQSGISSAACEKMGCCVAMSESACYYPLDECTGDQNFVFAIRHNSASIPVDPTKLVIPGNPDCKPVIVNGKVAIFKFKVTECGTRFYEVGEMRIYLAEVHTIVRALNLKFGVITRSDPLRFLIECRYSKQGAAQQSLASVGYMVKTPTSSLPSAVVSDGLYGVQLRLAKDEMYSSYFPTYHRPLQLLLGKPVYLELRLKALKPDAVILVNYCLAYPRSAKNALVLIYEGCANPHDPNVSVLKVSDTSKSNHLKRFTVDAFQFMDRKTEKYLNEEIYFMCSTEVCRPTEKMCEEKCFS